MVLEKYPVQYFRCEQCGFIQTEPPYWLDEAYGNTITRSDLGLVGRNIACARYAPAMILAFFNRHARFLDYGGGYGLFVRLMRDQGFDFYRSDRQAQNLFAVGFDAADNSNTNYELLTAFEVFEHLVEPLNEMERMLCFSRNILFSTRLVPSPPPDLNAWWYYGMEHGQHVSLYTHRALSHLAKQFGLNIYSNGRSVHLLTDRKLSNFAFTNVWFRGRILPWLSFLLAGEFRPRSLLPEDYHRLTGKWLD